MANIVLAYNNRVDAATLTGGSWSSTLPRANLQNRLIKKVARTADAVITSTLVNVDLGGSYAIGAVALINHNISVDGLVRVRGNVSSTMTSPLYDSGWVAAWPTGVVDDPEWEADNFWLATLSAAERAGFQAPYINLDTGRTVARYWRIEVDDTGNSDGYVQIGRLFMADIWAPERNYITGAGLSYEDNSAFDTSLGGQKFFDVRDRLRVHRIAWDALSEADAYNQVLEMQRLCGISGEVLHIPDPDDTSYAVRRNFVGRLRSLQPIVIKTVEPLFGVEMELEELL